MGNGGEVTPGDLAADREDNGTLVVVAATGREAAHYTVAAAGETVAALNSTYPADSPVLCCVYRTQLEEAFGSRWQNWTTEYLAFNCGDRGVPTYSFPRARLTRQAPVEDDRETAE
jgi:hypothetical protein